MKMIDTDKTWSGMLPIESLALLRKDQRPSRIGYIDNEQTWSAIWNSLHPDKTQPAINFSSQLVLVVKNVRFLNRIKLLSAVHRDGVLILELRETKTSRQIKGHVYCVMAAVDRQNIDRISDGHNEITVDA